ncbi:MAG TPA: ABC transporter permease [Clostridia bacterium]|jgi:peptide/nickel transport system permease protein|nr:MAG: putative D,D-dipeptide transport system permease protein DdpC [Firmicutes bacterium ADurb.Bin248]HOG01068.1 ABC transporter permease [Clostridia bacterium]HOS18966.1 ABC transporter permease [Clostridia bacterium]HPK14942.1 ABC transporter permease [Clostridia bacterium]
MESCPNKIDISQVDVSRIPRRNAGENIRKLWYKFSLNRVSVVGLALILLIAAAAIFYRSIVPYPEHIGAMVDFKNACMPPSWQHLCGTDQAGRDILSRIIYAFRGALTMGVVAILAILPLGGVLGLVAGYWNGRFVSNLIMRVADVFLSLPTLILVMCVSSIMTPSTRNAMLAISISWWPWYTRLVYGIVTSTRNEVYIRSAEVLGANVWHILLKEILPNALGPILTKMTLDFGVAILAGATLSFVGMGEQPPAPSLGAMVSAGVGYLPDQWWMAVFPALAIMLIVLGFNLLGDGIGDMLSDAE